MPTPDIDNIPESIDIPDVTTTSDVVPTPSAVVAPDPVDVPETPIDPDAPPPAAIPASSEAVPTGLENPAPQIQKKQETLTAILQRLQNLTVGNFFAADATDSPEIAEQKVYFKNGLTIDEEADNAITAFAKVYALDRFIGLDTKDLAKVYGVPIEQFGAKTRFQPQICLKFREVEINSQDLPLRDYKLVKEISFRLMENVPQNYDDLSALREKILTAFSGFSWLVSSEKTYTYRDFIRGYRLAIDIEREAFTDLVTKVLGVQNHSFDEQYVGDASVNRPLTPPQGNVLGNVVGLPFRGRWGTVAFWKAEYKQIGIEDKILATAVPL
jgi:hypothetical protein